MVVNPRTGLWILGLSAGVACGRSHRGLAENLGAAGVAGALASAGVGGTGIGEAGVGGRAVGGESVGGGAGTTTGGAPATGGVGGATAGAAGETSERPVDPSIGVPIPRLPENGDATGSVWVDSARAPRFSWEAVDGTTTEIVVDDSCENGNFQACDFPSPEWIASDAVEGFLVPPRGLPVNEFAPVGRRYFWRLRACTDDACSPWSSVRYVDVGRQHGDFNGDGYADVVLGNQGTVTMRGRAIVGFGPRPSERTVIVVGSEEAQAQDRFGFVTEPVGDLDGDGFADLLITAPGAEQTSGFAVVYFGSESFDDASRHVTLRVDGDAPGDRFGELGVAAGDVDGDGQRDFVLGFLAPGSPPLRFLRGSSRNVIPADLPIPQSEEFVDRVSVGDITGDGHPDLLAVNVSGDGDYLVHYDLLRGGPDGFGEPSLIHERTGYPVASYAIFADVNGDGFREVGRPFNAGATVSENRVDVSLGADPFVLDDSIVWPGMMVEGEPGPYGELQAPVAAGDVNGDGFDDAFVGVSWHTTTRVETRLFLGGGAPRSEPAAIYGFERELLFVSTGIPVAVGDVNGDGYDDLFLKETFGSSGEIFFGGAEPDAESDDQIALPLQ
jgi:hypothetical protein